MSVQSGREGARQAAAGSRRRTLTIVREAAKVILASANGTKSDAEGYAQVLAQARRRLLLIQQDVADEVARAVDVAAQRVARATGGTLADARNAVIETLGGPKSIETLVAQHIVPAEASVRRVVTAARRNRVPPPDVARDLSTMLLHGADGFSRGLASKYDLSQAAFSDLYTVPSDMARIAAVEPMNVMRATAQRSLLRQGYDLGVWTLSDAHDTYDECDELANAQTDWGVGVYPLLLWPRAPHPHCGCFPTPVENAPRAVVAEDLLADEQADGAPA